MKHQFSKFLVTFLLTSGVVLSWSEYFFFSNYLNAVRFVNSKSFSIFLGSNRVIEDVQQIIEYIAYHSKILRPAEYYSARKKKCH